MFSKFTMSLIVTISLMLSSNVFAQTAKKADAKKVESTKAVDTKAAEAAAQKAEAEKALEAKRAEEAKAASEKAKVEDSSGFFGYMKSHFSASYHGEFYFHRRVDVYNDRVANNVTPNENDKDIQDLKIMHIPTVIYRPFTNWKILATSEFKYTDAAKSVNSASGNPDDALSLNGTFINRHYRSLISVTRENLLTEKENGLKLDVGIARRIFDRNHGAASSYGNNRVNTTISKKFLDDKLSTSILVQYMANDPAKKKIRSTTWKHSLNILPSINYQITEKLSYFFNDDFAVYSPWHNDTYKNSMISHDMNLAVFTYQENDKNSTYFQFKYIYGANAPFQRIESVDESFEYYIGHTYSFTPKFSITPEVGSELFKSHDKRDFFAQKVKYPEFAIYVDYAL